MRLWFFIAVTLIVWCEHAKKVREIHSSLTGISDDVHNRNEFCKSSGLTTIGTEFTWAVHRNKRADTVQSCISAQRSMSIGKSRIMTLSVPVCCIRGYQLVCISAEL